VESVEPLKNLEVVGGVGMVVGLVAGLELPVRTDPEKLVVEGQEPLICLSGQPFLLTARDQPRPGVVRLSASRSEPQVRTAGDNISRAEQLVLRRIADGRPEPPQA
jgi:hypothetical protein